MKQKYNYILSKQNIKKIEKKRQVYIQKKKKNLKTRKN